ncbi:MAG: hypothetical protein S4CHLAM2_09780 [Chlamydiales bacterium]|nr:hypothetical protein [Chlamydiales bacterium]
MIESLLAQEEGKTLEFKENTSSLAKIVQTAIAFANSAGGTIVVGIRDKTKEIVGLDDILTDEARVANAIADSVEPLLTPNLQLVTWRGRDLLLVTVMHSIGPYYQKAKGEEQGTYVRLGSTNRLADTLALKSIHRLKDHVTYDEMPCQAAKENDLDMNSAREMFAKYSKPLNKSKAVALGLYKRNQSTVIPSNGGILLFGKYEAREEAFPNMVVRCARFKSTTKSAVIDKQDLAKPLPLLIDAILDFIQRNTTTKVEIGRARRQETPQYPPVAIREAVINAIVHTDYSIKGSNIQVAIFDDRLEITNPGALPPGLSWQTALSGVSQLRNHVIGRIFHELLLIEQWGSGLGKIIETTCQYGLAKPCFEELDNFFRVTFYASSAQSRSSKAWHAPILEYLTQHEEILPREAQKIWDVTSRTTSTRLKQMCQEGLIVEISTGPYDPQKTFRFTLTQKKTQKNPEA